MRGDEVEGCLAGFEDGVVARLAGTQHVTRIVPRVNGNPEKRELLVNFVVPSRVAGVWVAVQQTVVKDIDECFEAFCCSTCNLTRG